MPGPAQALRLGLRPVVRTRRRQTFRGAGRGHGNEMKMQALSALKIPMYAAGFTADRSRVCTSDSDIGSTPAWSLVPGSVFPGALFR